MSIHLFTQLILLISLPFIAYFYSAEQIGQWAICTTICSIVITTGGGKFYFSIFKESPIEQKMNLAWLTVLLGGCFSLGLVGLLSLLGYWRGIYSFLWESTFKGTMVGMLGLYCFTAICNLLFEHLLTLKENWNFLSYARLLKTIIYLGVVYFGRSLGVMSLILALMLGQLTGMIFVWVFGFGMKWPKVFELSDLITTLKEYKHNFNFGMSKSLIINSYDHLMAIWIQSVFGSALLGQFSLADRLARFPMQGLGQPMTERLFQRMGITPLDKISKLLEKYLVQTFLMISFLGLGLAVFGPYLIHKILGNKWNMTSSLLPYFMMWIPTIFCLASIRGLPFIIKAQRYYFLLEVGLYAILIGLFWFFTSLNTNFIQTISYKLMAESVLFLAATVLMVRFSRKMKIS